MSSASDDVGVRIEWIRTLGIIGVAAIGLVGGWVASNSNNASQRIEENQSRKFAITYYARQDHWTIPECTQKIADGLVQSKLPYEDRGSKGVYLNFGNSYAFAFCVPDITDETKVGRVLVGASHPSTGEDYTKFESDWKKFIYAIEGIVNANRP